MTRHSPYIPVFLLLAMTAVAQTPAGPAAAQLSANDANQLCQRTIQLMDAGGVAIPDLQRAAAPVIENVRTACGLLQAARQRRSTDLCIAHEPAGVPRACRRGS